jgi:hypothetical protein
MYVSILFTYLNFFYLIKVFFYLYKYEESKRHRLQERA